MEWAQAPKGENARSPGNLKGQTGSNDEILGRAERASQAEEFWFYSLGTGNHREFLEFWFLASFTTARTWRWPCYTISLTPTWQWLRLYLLLDTTSNSPTQSSLAPKSLKPTIPPSGFSWFLQRRNSSGEKIHSARSTSKHRTARHAF